MQSALNVNVTLNLFEMIDLGSQPVCC